MSDGDDRGDGPDPAAVAAAEPETRAAFEATERPVEAVGIGPGNPEYLTSRGERAIREADVVVGFETVVAFISGRTDADLLTCGYADEAATLDAFAERVADGERGTAVLMGDPNHSGYQFVGKVEAAVDRPVTVVPGISSLQIAASRARTPMEASTFVTLHKRGGIDAELRRLREAVGDRHLLVLPRPYDWMPGDIAAVLVEAGVAASLDVLVFERLTHDDERVTRTTLGDLASRVQDDAGDTTADESRFSDLSVLVVRAD
ncbi:cobalt-precorrin-7 (C(5))-methyltransferase [Halococcus saccharolyticus]|uniref:Cobalt-precorrin-6Y C(5)-methyltransferase n=1 Tax=Halococcus saccharolyticus DSM 5350 TaxID=1227455 RepID=M0MHP5_9EURY|nr:cobalt-precorrin-7 (C(5))-methyltransferase [Halococcus saccharolyticus]EMA44863.1 cobalt-precorrin-6Y C(5)-methyltransferase [Halococcus saccharolyticus DSM 5350]